MVRASVAAVFLALVILPGSALAATTIGSDLSQSGGDGFCTGNSAGTRCTALQLTLGIVDQAVPADGVITRWAVRDAAGELALRVIDGPPGQRHVVASGPAVQASGGTQSFSAQLPVKAGQRIGVELGESGYLPFHFRDDQTTGERYIPALGADPAAPVPGADISTTYELLYNATVEPDADHDGLGDETQDPDHGGTGSGAAACPTKGVLARGAGSVVFHSGRKVFGCRDGQRTRIGTRSARNGFKLFRFNGAQLALVQVNRGKSFIEVFDLGARRHTLNSRRTYSRGTRPIQWKVTDLVVAPNGDAAWISTLRGVPDKTGVWVRHRARVQQIDTGKIRPRSLTLSADNAGVNYTHADGSHGNSSFG